MNEGPQPKTARRWLRWFLILVLILIVGIGGAISLAIRDRLALADWALTEGAVYFGFPEATFKFSALEHNHLQIDQINMGDDLSVASVRLSYSSTTLMNGQIDRVAISGLKLDATHLGSGVLGKIQKMIADNSGAPSTGSPTPLPAVSLRDAFVHGRQAGIDFSFTINADMNPDQSGTFNATGNVQSEQLEHHLKADEVRVGGEFNAAAKTVKLKLDDIAVSDNAKNIWFSPLIISGKADFDGAKGSYIFSVKDSKQQALSQISGSFDPASESTSANVLIPELVFSKNSLQPQHLSPLARLPFLFDGVVSGSANIDWADGKLQTKADLRLTKLGFNVDKTSIKNGEARFTVRWPSANNKADLSVHLPTALVTQDGIPLKLSSAMTHVVIDPLSKTIDYNLTSVDLQHMADPPMVEPVKIQAEGQLTQKTVTLDAKVFDKQKSVSLVTFKGKHTLAIGEGSADVMIGPLTFAPGIFQPAELASQLGLLQDVNGEIAGQSKLFWSKAGLKGVVETRIDQLAFRTDTISVDGLQGRIMLSEIWPPRTMGPQLVRANNISTAASLNTPEISFSIRPGNETSSPRLTIHHLKSGIVGGQMFIRGMTIDPSDTTHSFDLHLQELDLERVFSLIELEGVSGNGKLSGSIPLSVTGDDVVISDAQLASVAPGILRFQSEQAKQALGGGGEQVELLLNVLTDFRYDELSLGIGRQSGGAANFALHLKGHNPAVMDGHPFNLNINLEGNVDRLLAAVLEGYRLSDRAIRATLNPR